MNETPDAINYTEDPNYTEEEIEVICAEARKS
jgi:hypothetical protein